MNIHHGRTFTTNREEPGKDRGQVIFPSAEAAAARQDEFVDLVREWVRA